MGSLSESSWRNILFWDLRSDLLGGMSQGIAWSCWLACVYVAAAASSDARRITGGSLVSFASNPDWKFLVAVYIDERLRCPGVLLSTQHVLLAASCFESLDTTGGIFDGELQRHHEQVLKVAGWRVVVEIERTSVDLFTFSRLGESAKHAAQTLTIHPNYDQTCGTQYDVAILTLVDAAVFTNSQKVAEGHGIGSFGTLIAAGWGKITNLDRSTLPGGDLRAVTSFETEGDCTSKWIDFNSDRQICSTGKLGGSGVCNFDEGSVLFYMSSSTPIVVGLLTSSAGTSCPSEYSRWSRVSAYKDWICQVVGCADDTGVDSQGSTGLCRWTALQVHAIMGLIFCGGIVPFSLALTLMTYEIERQKDGAVDVNYLRESYPNVEKGVFALEVGGVVFFVVPAVIVVAVGLAPRHLESAHSWLGYLLLILYVFQSLLTTFLRFRGTEATFKDQLHPHFIVQRVSIFTSFMLYILVLYVETPLGILRMGYGLGGFFGWWGYLCVLHVAHLVWVKTSRCASKNKKVHPEREIDDLEELEPKSRRGSKSRRASSVSPAPRRESLSEFHKPYFVQEKHVNREEKQQKRRESVADEIKQRNNTNMLEKFGTAITRRRSFTEGVSDFFDEVTSQGPVRESVRQSVAKRGDNWAAIRRASVAGTGRSSYEGPRETGEQEVQESQKRLQSQRASLRRGSVSNMNSS